jgi:ABC-type dipeptide/oligopeptide/nickel transport system permease component
VRNALSPQLTSFGLTLAFAITGAVLVETVFSWPGLGQLAYQAMLARDYPLIQGTVLLVAVLTIGANLLVDVLYAYVDPRIRY